METQKFTNDAAANAGVEKNQESNAKAKKVAATAAKFAGAAAVGAAAAVGVEALADTELVEELAEANGVQVSADSDVEEVQELDESQTPTEEIQEASIVLEEEDGLSPILGLDDEEEPQVAFIDIDEPDDIDPDVIAESIIADEDSSTFSADPAMDLDSGEMMADNGSDILDDIFNA